MIGAALILASTAVQAAPPLPPPVAAVPAAAPVDPARLTVAKQLLAAMHLDQQYDAIFSRLIPVMSVQLFSSLKNNTTVPASLRSYLADPANAAQAERVFAQEASAGFKSQYAEFSAATAREYAGAFSADELGQLLAFYRSPVGQKTLAVLPAVQAKLIPIGMAAGARIGQAALGRTIERLHLQPGKPKA